MEAVLKGPFLSMEAVVKGPPLHMEAVVKGPLLPMEPVVKGHPASICSGSLKSLPFLVEAK